LAKTCEARSPSVDLILPTALSPFPRLHAAEKEDGFHDDNASFPGDALVFEDNVVDERDIQCREHCHEPSNDGIEQELVAPDVKGPLCEVALAAWLHPQERASRVHHLPCQEQGEPSRAYARRGTGAKHRILDVAIVAIAI
jgi:hypothetical protein